MAGIMQPIREPSPIEIEDFSRIPQITVSQTAGFSEVSRMEQLDASNTSSNMLKLNLSKSYAHGLSNSAETVRFFQFFEQNKKRSLTHQVINDVTLSHKQTIRYRLFLNWQLLE